MRDRNAIIATAAGAQRVRRGPMRLVLWAALCGSLGLAGCASSGVEGPLLFADAGKYHFHNCEQLAAAAKGQSTRQRELKELIDKAEQGAGGQIVSVLAYRSDYVAVNEDLQVIEATAREKRCPPAAASPAPAPAASKRKGAR
jgi:hypothetical protein